MNSVHPTSLNQENPSPNIVSPSFSMNQSALINLNQSADSNPPPIQTFIINPIEDSQKINQISKEIFW